MGQDRNLLSNLRQNARDAVREGRHTEAFIHLSHAIKLDQTNVELLSERARVSADNLQYSFAIEDAGQILQLRPESWLGHVRMAEVYMVTVNLDMAISSYQAAFQCLDADKVHCKTMMDKCKRDLVLDQRVDMQLPWVGCALGMIVSSLVVVLDYLSHGHTSYIAHPLLKILLCALASLIGYCCAYLYRLYLKKIRSQMLEPPLDLLDLADINGLTGSKIHSD